MKNLSHQTDLLCELLNLNADEGDPDRRNVKTDVLKMWHSSDIWE
jgi:hypothetical protein